MTDLNHDDEFTIDQDLELRALYTPGHASDHISLLMKPMVKSDLPKEEILFSGDIILGTPSTSVQDLHSYMQTLYSLRKENFSHICLPHSLNLEADSIVVPGKDKLEAYITYREDRDKAIV